MFSSLIRNSALGGLDQAGGFLFGVLRGGLLVAIAFIVYDRAVADAAIPMVDSSRSAAIFAQLVSTLETSVPQDAPGWIVQRYETLVGACAPAEG
jgi:membrane protein required for colicin V production